MVAKYPQTKKARTTIPSGESTVLTVVAKVFHASTKKAFASHEKECGQPGGSFATARIFCNAL